MPVLFEICTLSSICLTARAGASLWNMHIAELLVAPVPRGNFLVVRIRLNVGWRGFEMEIRKEAFRSSEVNFTLISSDPL